jgi:hypothetical protein
MFLQPISATLRESEGEVWDCSANVGKTEATPAPAAVSTVLPMNFLRSILRLFYKGIVNNLTEYLEVNASIKLL